MSIFRGVAGMTTCSPPNESLFSSAIRSVSNKYSKGKIGPWQTEMCDSWKRLIPNDPQNLP